MEEQKAHRTDSSEMEEEQRLGEIAEMLYEAKPMQGQPLGPDGLQETLEQRLDRMEENARRLERKIDRVASRLGLPDFVVKGMKDL